MKVEDILKSKNSRCPVCGWYVEEYDICPNCNWQNDPLQRDDENLEGEANTESLKEYRKEYLSKLRKNGDR